VNTERREIVAQLSIPPYEGIKESYIVEAREATGGSGKRPVSERHHLARMSAMAVRLKATLVALALLALVVFAPRAVMIPLGVILLLGVIVFGVTVALEGVLKGRRARGQGSGRYSAV
jgi:hypothetical protein